MKKAWIFFGVVLILWAPSGGSSYAEVLETFSSEASTDGFRSLGNWSISGGGFHYNNPNPTAGSLTWISWSGGDNPGGWAPSLAESNYFFEVSVSVTVNGSNGPEDKYYGLYVSGQENSNDRSSLIVFMISRDGYYLARELKDDEWGVSAVAIKSEAVTGQNDRLTIVKQGDLFRFFINYNEVEFLKIEGHFGGSAGLIVEHEARTSFDDFEIVDLADFQPEYKANSKSLVLPLLDVLNAGAASGEYEASLKLVGAEPVSFSLAEIDAHSRSFEPFSWYDIFNRINFSPYRPSFDLGANIMRIPSVRLDDGADGATLIGLDLELRTTDDGARFQVHGVDSYSPDCYVADWSRWLYNRMLDIYYWYDRIPAVDPAAYSSAGDLLEALLYTERDRWSYIAPRAGYTSLFEEGTYVGVGFGTRYDSENNVRISHVHRDSPAGRAGLERGYELLNVNGKTVEEIIDGNLWGTVFGEDREGVAVRLKFENLQGKPVELTLVKDLVKIDTVFYSDVFESGGRKVGYLVFLEFLDISQEELNAVFTDFKQQGVNELILDLRYNGGGRGHIAAYLASLITGDDADGGIFATSMRNDKHQDRNFDYFFVTRDNSLDLSRVIVITTSSTCSASELVINGLGPFIDVVTVGRATCGKPVGMSGQYFCDRILSPIVFEARNADGEGEYYDGFAATCPASDGLTTALGNANEPSLKEALYYVENGRCSPGARSGPAASAPPAEGPHVSGLRRIIGSY